MRMMPQKIVRLADRLVPEGVDVRIGDAAGRERQPGEDRNHHQDRDPSAATGTTGRSFARAAAAEGRAAPSMHLR